MAVTGKSSDAAYSFCQSHPFSYTHPSSPPTIWPPAHGSDRGVQRCGPQLLPVKAVDTELAVIGDQGQ
eukprot:967291-Pelagomonas_calceolata.AAC.1